MWIWDCEASEPSRELTSIKILSIIGSLRRMFFSSRAIANSNCSTPRFRGSHCHVALLEFLVKLLGFFAMCQTSFF